MRSTFGRFLRILRLSLLFTAVLPLGAAFADGTHRPVNRVTPVDTADAAVPPLAPVTISRDAISRIVDKHAVLAGISADLVESIIAIESDWKPYVTNGTAVGLMQIKPLTARSMGYRGTVEGLFDPETNIAYGVKYLAKAFALSDGDLCGTVMRYQSGHDAVQMNAANRRYCAKARILIASNAN